MSPSEKSATYRLSDLTDDEALELRKFFEGYGITAEKETPDIKDLMLEKLAEHVKTQEKNPYWMYYMLGDMLTMNGQLDESIGMYAKATKGNPADPRAWYCLGVLHRAISYEPDRIKIWEKDLKKAQEKDQKLAEHMQQWEKQNSQFLQAAINSQLAQSPVVTADQAIKYFKKALNCDISEPDKAGIQKQIDSIQTWKKSKK
jgi:tetratricopeptide (TPR) repeat protein